MTRFVVEMADRHCEGRVVSLLEGGYDLNSVTSSVEAHVQELLGK
jgi:acetoin utilization deacetylase AcuC-like enzyme